MRKLTVVLYRSRALLAVAALAIPTLFFPTSSHAQNIDQTVQSGSYTLDLKVLPTETFKGEHAAMTRDSGAEPASMTGMKHPNHHLVVFIKQNGKPVEDAAVTISYRNVSPTVAHWTTLPVMRMHAADEGAATTHYGNNVYLAAGKYEVRVTVAGSRPAMFRFTLS